MRLITLHFFRNYKSVNFRLASDKSSCSMFQSFWCVFNANWTCVPTQLKQFFSYAKWFRNKQAQIDVLRILINFNNLFYKFQIQWFDNFFRSQGSIMLNQFQMHLICRLKRKAHGTCYFPKRSRCDFRFSCDLQVYMLSTCCLHALRSVHAVILHVHFNTVFQTQSISEKTGWKFLILPEKRVFRNF